MDYPYMYARVSAKRAKLLENGDYENLLKMQPNEIARKLEEGAYRSEINELGARYEGVELVELALNRNLSNELSHLCKIAPESLEKVIKAYLRKYDLRSIKRLLRWKKSGEEARIDELLIPVSNFDMENLRELSEKDFEEILEEIRFPDSEIDYRSSIEGKTDLKEIEHALDEAYYDELQKLSEAINTEQFRRFIREEVEHQNISTVLRLKKYGLPAEEISNYLVASNHSKLVENVLEAEELESAIDLVREEKDIGGFERLEDIEHALEVERLQKALTMLHTEPLGVTSILGYIVAKIIEVKNLRMLIRAKETGIQNLDTIRRNLVTA